MQIDFATDPARYRHWRLECDGGTATLILDVDPLGGLFPGTELKLNSYDLGVYIELADAVARLPFEHPEVRAVVIRSGKENVFCAGANIGALARASHAHKVNFCKFTNETLLAIEESSAGCEGPRYIAALGGTAAGGGYELALACDHIMLIDDRRSAVSLPEVPLLGVLPGTGGLTRLIEKRRVRRDIADQFCTSEEGVRGQRALDWGLVDELVPPSAWDDRLQDWAQDHSGHPGRREDAVTLPRIKRTITDDAIAYDHVAVALDRKRRLATITVFGPEDAPDDPFGSYVVGGNSWPIAIARELDDAILHLRFNEPELGLIVFRCEGDPAKVLAWDHNIRLHRSPGAAIRGLWSRVLKRIDMTARTLITLIEPGSCFAGVLAELAFAADRTYMFAGSCPNQNKPPAGLSLSESNFGFFPMGNGVSRLENRLYGGADGPDTIQRLEERKGLSLPAESAVHFGLVTAAYDAVDWDEEIRLVLEERASFSPDALTGLEANLRFAGPETIETKIFGRLSAWQNWIFQRPNAVGDEGALKRYGTGQRPRFEMGRT